MAALGPGGPGCRPAIPHVARAAVCMVIRADTLAWPEDVYARVFRALADWRTAGNRVAGLQVDFDAATRHLASYASYLRDLRRRMPAGLRLGITGYAAYLARLGRVPVPFRIGLPQGGEGTEPDGLARMPLFRGYVVFLVNR